MSDAIIRIHFAGGASEERPLTIGRYEVGRDAGDIVLGDPNVSGRHALIEVRPGLVVVTDQGSTNGTFDLGGVPIRSGHRLAPGDAVRMGSSTITLVSVAPVAATQVMPQVAAQAYPPSPQPLHAPSAAVAAPAAVAASAAAPSDPPGSPSAHSHPSASVRHSYPVRTSASGFGLGEAVALLGRSAPYVMARLGVLLGATFAAFAYWMVVITVFLFLAPRSGLVAWGWLIGTLGVAGWFWHAVVRYFLYLLKAGHVAVLTELITSGRIGNGDEGMFTYGRRVVTERFGQVNVLFFMDMLVDCVVRAFNRTLDWIGSLVPIPGLDSVMGVVQGILRASTTYIDETIFSYNLARGDENAFRSSKDGIIYYAQNAKEILKTGVVIVLLEKVAAFAMFIVLTLPLLGIFSLLPDAWGPWVQITALMLGFGVVRSVQQAVLRPLFLTMILVKFHAVVQGQAIDATWDARLEKISAKFGELKQKALGGSAQPAPTGGAPVAA